MSARLVVELARSPGALETYRRAALQRAHGTDRVPEKVLRLSAVTPQVDRVAAYAQVCGDRLTSVLPPLFPHLLGFGLQMALLTDGDSPFPAIGLVHVANDVTIGRPIPIGVALDVEVEMRLPQPHRRGRTIDLIARVNPAGDDEVIWRSVSTYLRRESSASSPDGASSRSASPEFVPTDLQVDAKSEPLPGPAALWQLPSDLGRSYGAVSGDRNPIHLSALTARPFGFPRAIAHGMWTAARSLAALEGRLPARYRNVVEFRAPITLPSTVQFVDQLRADRITYQVRARGKDRLHLVGDVTEL